MKRLIAFVKALQFKQVLSFLFAGMLVLLSTACSPAAQALLPGESDQGIPGHRSQQYEGGMNGYSDTDPRRSATDAAATKIQAKGLKDNAQRNVIDMTDDLKANTDRTLDKKAENLKQLGNNAKRDAKDFGNKVDDATDDLQDTSKAVKENVRSAGKEYSKDAKQAAESVKDKVKDVSKNVSDKAKSAAKDTANSIKNGTDEASKPSSYYNISGNN